MLCGADQERYSKLVEELQNYFTKGRDNYPVKKTEAYNLLVNYKMTHSNPETRIVDDSE